MAGWLRGVAYRKALEARTAAAKRRARERTVVPPALLPEDPWAELWPVLDQELSRLAEKYRAAVVLCDLEGKTRNEAAQQLGWAPGTVASRLARGRDILAKRLARRGFSAALVALAIANSADSACVPAHLVHEAVKAAASSPALPSATVIALTEGVLKSMLLSKIKNTFAVFLVLGVLALATAGLLSTTQATEPDGGGQDKQKQAQAKPDDVHQRVLDLKQQLQQMQKKIAQLEDETQPAPSAGDAPDLAKRFKYRVPFELGYTEAKEGGRLDIREVWGTRPKIEIGGQYLVRGKYVLPPGAKGKIYFYVTATGDWGREPTATLDLQAVSVEKQEGEFTLVHGMAGPGYFHLYLADPERYSRTFANVYFGTGDNVLRKMP